MGSWSPVAALGSGNAGIVRSWAAEGQSRSTVAQEHSDKQASAVTTPKRFCPTPALRLFPCRPTSAHLAPLSRASRQSRPPSLCTGPDGTHGVRVNRTAIQAASISLTDGEGEEEGKEEGGPPR